VHFSETKGFGQMADDITPDKTDGFSEPEGHGPAFDELESLKADLGDSTLREDADEPAPPAFEPPAEQTAAEAPPAEPPAEQPESLSWLDSAPRTFSTEPGADSDADAPTEPPADDSQGDGATIAAVTAAEVAAAHGLTEAASTAENGEVPSIETAAGETPAGETPAGEAPAETPALDDQGEPILGDTGEVAPVDPAAAQMTQLLPEVGAAEVIAPAPVGPLVTSGSRVVVVVSRGPSPIPSSAFVPMPSVMGQMQGEALAKLQEVGLSAQVFNDFSPLPRGEVFGQLPQFGANTPTGTEAVVLVSGGPAPVAAVMTPLPDVVGLPEADAILKLQVAGLAPQIVRDYSSNVQIGVVTDQVPSGHSIAEAPKEKRKLGLWWLWLLLAVAVLVAIAGGVYYYLNRTAIVPSVVGLPQAQAEQAIAAAGFTIGNVSTTQTISASQVGNITSQTPAANTTLKLTQTVAIVVSGGQQLFAVPNVVGKPEADAKNELMSAKLQVSVTQAYNPTVAKGNVVSQSPAAAQKVPSGTTVGIVVSMGVQSVNVPSVITQSKSGAATTLKAAGLGSQALTVRNKIYGSGTVFAQYPTAGTAVPPGRIVGYLVSSGSSETTPTMVSVPALIGQTQKAAQTKLKNVSLGSASVQWSGTNRPAGEVVGQLPDAGVQVIKNSSILLFVSNGK
jgi:beta-lactam-binding protein with PASTA domain